MATMFGRSRRHKLDSPYLPFKKAEIRVDGGPMATLKPADIAKAAVESGTAKAHERWDKTLVAAFLAGAYIAFGALVALVTSAGLNVMQWGGIPTLITGVTFSLGLVLVIIAGSDLLTGNMLLVPISYMARRLGFGAIIRNFSLVLIGNLAGALFVAYFLAVQTGVVGHGGTSGMGGLTYERLAGIATSKGVTETDWQVFLRGVGCNWLVCLAVWIALAADSVSGKILGILFPITAFVAMGFDHVVANMFFLPAAVFADVPGLGWGDVVRNLIFAFLGNLVGAVVFVASTYWYLYLREDPAEKLRSASSQGVVP
jgi:formate transporter